MSSEQLTSSLSYGHTHQPLPLRSAMKHTSSTNTSTPYSGSRPTTPSSPTISPFITRIPLPPASPIPHFASPYPSRPSGPLRASSATSTTTLSSFSPIPPFSATTINVTTPTTAGTVGTYTNNSASPNTLFSNPTSPPTNFLSPSIAASGYTPKVSFDTFENPAASMFSFTLQVKSDGYRRTRSTRVFLCAASSDESGREALDWALEALVQDGDELIVCRGVDEEVLEKDHDIVRDEARELMRQIQEKSVEYDPERKLSLILEYVPGKITDTLDRLIALYRPDSVVVGTRGRRAWQGMGMGIGMGSVSKYCLTHSPVPIIVVRPERKVKKAVEKRRANPKRGTHFDDDKPPTPVPRAKTYNIISSVPLSPSNWGSGSKS